MNWFIERLKEPSTAAGLGILATLFGAPPGAVDGLMQIVGGLFAVVAIAAKEKK